MNDTAQIEKYFAGELGNEEMKAFEARLKTDAAFAENFSLYKAIQSEMQEGDDEQEFRDKLSTHTRKYFTETNETKVIPIGSNKRKWWMYAAAAAACITMVMLWKPWQDKTLSNDQVYAQNAIPDELPTFVRGSNDDSLQLKASELFNKKDYTAALPILDSICKLKPAESQLQLSLDICYVQLGKFDSASHKLDDLATGQSIYKYEALYWKALALLKQNKKDTCIEVLKQIPADAANYKKVEKMLKDLSK